MTTRRIYLDYNASTPVDPAVSAVMKPFLTDHYGNPSRGHWASTGAKAAVETARSQVAAVLGCHNDEIVFTSGGSEANNLALKGVVFKLREEGLSRPASSIRRFSNRSGFFRGWACG